MACFKSIWIFTIIFVSQLCLVYLAPSTITTSQGIQDIPNIRIRQKRSSSNSKLWSNGVISFRFELNSNFTDSEKCLVKASFLHIMLHSCVLFKVVDSSSKTSNFLLIKKSGESSPTSQVRLNQNLKISELILGNDSFNFDAIKRKLLKVIGLVGTSNSGHSGLSTNERDLINQKYNCLNSNKANQHDRDLYLHELKHLVACLIDPHILNKLFS